MNQYMKRLTTSCLSTISHQKSNGHMMMMNRSTMMLFASSAQQQRFFTTSDIMMGKTDGNNPNPLPKPYELARRRKIALAKKQGRDLQAEQDAQRKLVHFPNKYISLWVPSVLKPTKQVVFHVPMDVTKPEIKEILTNYYDLNVKKVHTLILRTKSKPMRRGARGQTAPAVKSKHFKKAMVFLHDEVDLGLDENIKKTIEQFYDRRKMREYKQEAMKERMRNMQQKQEDFVNKEDNKEGESSDANTENAQQAQIEAK